MTTEEWRPRLRHQFTVAEMRDALNQLIEAGVGDQPILMEGPDGFEHWSGTFHHVAQFDGRRYVVAENYDDIWEREPPVDPFGVGTAVVLRLTCVPPGATVRGVVVEVRKPVNRLKSTHLVELDEHSHALFVKHSPSKRAAKMPRRLWGPVSWLSVSEDPSEASGR